MCVQCQIIVNLLVGTRIIKVFGVSFAGPSSYKQHGYRMLRIWVDSLGPDLDPIEELIDSLNTVEKKTLAGNVYTF